MDELWEQIESWLSDNAPKVLDGLNPGASEQELNDAELALSVHFPADFREAYLVHNGSDEHAQTLFPGGEFLSLARIVEEWSTLKDLLDEGSFRGAESEADRGIHNDWFNPRWIPFTCNEAGDHYCLDLAPSSWGTNGQIITMWQDSPERELVASSFGDVLELILEKLQSGEYIYSADYDGIISIEDCD